MPARRPLLAAGAALAGALVLGACSGGSGPSVTGATVGTIDPAPDARPNRTLPGLGTGTTPGTTRSTTRGTTPGTTSGTTPGTALGPRKAKVAIGQLTLPSRITCHGTVDVEVRATYETSGAAAVGFIVDGRPVSGAGATTGSVPGTTPADPDTSGSFDVPIRCDGNAHTVVLTAVDAEGGTVVESRAVLTETEPQGD